VAAAVAAAGADYYSSYINKKIGGRGRSEKKGFHAVNSKRKLAKNLFLVGSFLTC
jgi:hypothetical protein